MCGIFGYSARTARYRSTGELTAMADALRHRGPDGWGVHKRKQAAIGMLRLRMRAAPDEDQPIPIDPDCFAAYNGEIYSDASGAVPSGGRGEVEVLLKPSPLRPVDGMFAAALLEVSSDTVTLTRDTFGIKPLYLRHERDAVLFASEVGALLPFGDSLTVRRSAVHQFLAVGRPLDSDWFLADIAPVKKGSCVLLRNGEATHRDTWSADYLLRSRGKPPPSPAELRAAIGQSVERALISHYPVGVAVSGGLDSSIVCAEIARLGRRDITLITVRAEGSSDGLTNISDLGLSGTAWHDWNLVECTIGPDDYFALTKRAVRTFGFPTRMSSSALYLALADAAAECGTTTLLVGEGADELFCGYDSNRTFAAGGTLKDHVFKPGMRALLAKVIDGDAMAELDLAIEQYISTLPGRSDWDRLRMSDFSLILEPLLARADHALMARTIEGRTPFLHGEVPDLAFRFDESAHLANGKTKQTLRNAYDGRLAPQVISGQKTHFRAPILNWLSGPLYEQTRDVLLGAVGLLEPCGISEANVDALLRSLRTGDGEAADLTYRLLNLAWWLQWLAEKGSLRFI
jgi:asparagine synthase (glutamine-hydrolysing)